MTGFDKRFPRPEYSDKVPISIFLTVNFIPSPTSKCCYFFIGRDTQPIASATYEGGQMSQQNMYRLIVIQMTKLNYFIRLVL